LLLLLLSQEGLSDELELQSWFIKKVGRYLDSKGRHIIGGSQQHLIC
jgi:N-acetyl-beta-hexosaminidase